MHSASWCGATISCGVSPRRWCKIGYACTSHATSVAHNDLIHWWWLVNVCEHVGVQRQTHSASNLPLKRCGKCQFRALTEPRRVTSVRVENHSSGRQRELSSLLWRVARVKANARAHRNMHTGTCTAHGTQNTHTHTHTKVFFVSSLCAGIVPSWALRTWQATQYLSNWCFMTTNKGSSHTHSL